ncbi:MAG: hypothetical protein OEY86_15945 [Nitrospira sp.]|nr:hypothetical protein [Nitrospira sp.]
MAQTTDQRFRPIILFSAIAASGILLAHSINAFVADALTVAPELLISAQDTDSSGSPQPVSYSPAHYAEDVRRSGLFVLPPPSQESREPGGSAGAPNHGKPGAPVRASLGAAAKIRLIGVVMGDQQGVFAVVEDQSSKTQTLYRLHDHISDLGEVADIKRNAIIIRQGNLEELVELASPNKPATADTNAAKPGSPTAGSPHSAGIGPPLKQVVDRREVEQAMNNLPQLMTQARAVPNMVNGSINGFRLDYIAPSSFYEKIGVKTGDVLQRVNGVDIRDPGTILSLLQQLKNEEVVKMDIIRNNQRSTVTYELR